MEDLLEGGNGLEGFMSAGESDLNQLEDEEEQSAERKSASFDQEGKPCG